MLMTLKPQAGAGLVSDDEPGDASGSAAVPVERCRLSQCHCVRADYGRSRSQPAAAHPVVVVVVGPFFAYPP